MFSILALAVLILVVEGKVLLETCSVPEVPNGKIGRFVPGKRLRTVDFKEIQIGTEIEDNENLHLVCLEGFNPLGQNEFRASITCIGGKWSDDPHCDPVLLETCRVPEVPNGKIGRFVPEKHLRADVFKEITVGSEIEDNENLFLVCDRRYDSLGQESSQARITCIEGKWSDEPHCEPASCRSEPPSANNSRAVKINHKHGGTIQYQCLTDLKEVKSGNVSCDHGEWIGDLPICRELCIVPEVRNGKIGRYVPEKNLRRVVFNEIPVGTEVEENENLLLLCDIRYAPLGQESFQAIVICNGGKWTDEPHCEPASCQSEPPSANNSRVMKINRKHGGTVHYQCLTDLKEVKSGNVTCDHGEWIGDLTICGESCIVPEVPNGKIGRYVLEKYLHTEVFKVIPVGTEVEDNENLFLVCDRRYDSLGRENLQARINCNEGKWSDEPHCEPASCRSDPPTSNNSIAMEINSKHGGIVQYRCLAGLKELNSGTVTCDHGIWIGDVPICEEFCSVPEVPNGKIGRYVPQKHLRKVVFSEIPVGTKVEDNENLFLLCDRRYEPQGQENSPAIVICIGSKWTDEARCDPASCRSEPPSANNSRAVKINRKHGGTIQYQCLKDLKEVKSGNVSCDRGEWIGDLPICEEVCSIPEVPHGKIGRYAAEKYLRKAVFKEIPVGAEVQDNENLFLLCDRSYDPMGQENSQAIVICIEGKWINEPYCESASCRSDPPAANNSRAVKINPKHGSTIQYRCRTGFKEVKSGNVSCDHGEWIGDLPICGVEVPSASLFTTDFSIRVSEASKTTETAETTGTSETTETTETSETTEITETTDIIETTEITETTETSETTRITTLPTRSSNRSLKNATTDSSTAGSLDVQEQDNCSCTYSYLTMKVLAYVTGKRLHFGSEVKKGDTARIRCRDIKKVLTWPNGLRVIGSVNLTCNKCETWNEADIPNCVPLQTGDTWIIFNPQMKLLPGGIVEIRQNVNVQIQCANVNNEQYGMYYPRWKSLFKNVTVSYNSLTFGTFIEQSTYLDILDFKSEATGQYKCFAVDYFGQQHRASILNLTIAEPDILCPVIDEKDIFKIRYDNYGKANSNAYYSCRDPDQKILGSNIRHCQENGEWAGVDPECVVSTSSSLSSSVKECPEIDEKDSFIINYSNKRKIHSVAHYYCKSMSQTIYGLNTRTCQPSGKWSDSDPVCIGKWGCYVDVSNSFSFLKVEPMKDYYNFGEIIQLSCAEGYELTTQVERVMCTGSRWSDTLSDCKEK